MDVSRVARDLAAEQQVLDDIVAGLREDQWELQTPSPRWSIADQIGHLTYFDHAAAVAITDPAAFRRLLADFNELAFEDAATVDEFTLRAYTPLSPVELLAEWRRTRAAFQEAAATLGNDSRVDWYGPSMGSKSFITARLMEVWAHGQDIVDSLGVAREPTDRLRHIAQLGFITRGWSYVSRRREAPTEPLRLELTGPAGDIWAFGPDDTKESATGSALDFCLVVTQRRHIDDTGIVATPVAREWLLLAQAFAGPATDGPAAGARL
jgi:uncharacterized protein (TIGR03084 family)